MRTVIHYKEGAYLPLTENWIYTQIANLTRFKPIVYASKLENKDIYPLGVIRQADLSGLGASSRFFNRAANKLFGFYPYLRSYLRKDRPDLIHAHFGPSGYYALMMRNKYCQRVPLVTSFYGYDLGKLLTSWPAWKQRYRLLFDQGECFLAEGGFMRRALIDLGCPGHKIRLHHLGVDLSAIPFLPRESGPKKEVRILICSSFRAKKGVPYAVEAFARAKRLDCGSKLSLTIIGDAGIAEEENLQKKKTLEIIKSAGIQEDVVFRGFKPHRVFIEELSLHDIFLASSVSADDGDIEGGIPVGIIEASAAGLPVISCRHCDIPEAIIDDETGCLVKEKDVGALTEKLVYLATHQNLWKEMALKARRHISGNFDAKKQSALLEDIYLSLVGPVRTQRLQIETV